MLQLDDVDEHARSFAPCADDDTRGLRIAAASCSLSPTLNHMHAAYAQSADARRDGADRGTDMSIAVELVPILSDNYAYILRDEASGVVAVVDPGEPDGVAARLGDRLDMILLTHHHADHVGGAQSPRRSPTGSNRPSPRARLSCPPP